MTTVPLPCSVVFIREAGHTEGVEMNAGQLTRTDTGRNVTMVRGACRIDGTLTFVRRYGMNMVELGVVGYGTVRCFRDTPVALS